MKRILNRIPEIFFGLLSVYWIIDNLGAGHVNYFAIAAFLIIVLQVVYQKRIPGLIAGVVLGAFSSYMILAVISDYNKSGGRLVAYLFTAGGIFGIAVVMAAAMVYKFAVLQADRTEKSITTAS